MIWGCVQRGGLRCGASLFPIITAIYTLLYYSSVHFLIHYSYITPTYSLLPRYELVRLVLGDPSLTNVRVKLLMPRSGEGSDDPVTYLGIAGNELMYPYSSPFIAHSC